MIIPILKDADVADRPASRAIARRSCREAFTGQCNALPDRATTEMSGTTRNVRRQEDGGCVGRPPGLGKRPGAGAAAVFDPTHEPAGRLGHTARQRGIDSEGVGHLVHSLHLLASVLIDELAEQGWNVKRAASLY